MTSNKILRIAAIVFSFVTWIGQSLYAQELYRMQEGVQSHVSSPENPDGKKGEGGKTNAGAKGAAFTSLKTGDETRTLLDIHLAGMIQRMWFTVDNPQPGDVTGFAD